MMIFLMMLKDNLMHLTMMKMINDLFHKNKKAVGIFKDELGGKIMIELVGISSKTYAYLIDGYDDDKKIG